MNGKDIVWSKEIKDFAAYYFGYSGVSQKAAGYLWNKHISDPQRKMWEILEEYPFQSIMWSKDYRDIVKLLQRMTLYFGHGYVEDFIDIFKNEYGVEVTA